MSQLSWGVLGNAKIARTKVVPAISAAGDRLRAIASRSAESAKQAAAELGFECAYDSYQALLHDPEVDAVYIPLPNDLHVEWALKAVEAGKHVLCEKPIALGAEQLLPLITAAEQAGVVVVEGFMLRHHPQWHKVRELIVSGALGKVQAIHAVFGYFNDDPENIRNSLAHGGGALYDIGVYPIVSSRYALAAEPQRVLATMHRDGNFGTDVLTTAMLRFADCDCSFTVGTQLQRSQSMSFYGSHGRLHLSLPFNQLPEQSTTIELDTAERGTEQIEIDACDQFQLQIEAFGRYVAGEETKPYTLQDSLQMQRIIDAVIASAQKQQWISL